MIRRRTRVKVPNGGVRPNAPGSWVLVLTAAAQFVLQLDFSIVNVALPAVQKALSFSPAGLQWVVTGYALTYGALLLVGGRIADLIGFRRALLIGLTLFAATSLSGGLAWSPAVLVVSRLVQGAGAALVAPAALGMLTGAYPEPAERARALGVFQGSTAAGATAGIVLGGVFTQYLGWRSVLLINPPVIAVLAVLISRKLPALPSRHRGAELNVRGAVLITGAVGSFIYGLSQGQTSGFATPVVFGVFAVTAALTAAFVRVEIHTQRPLVPAELLRDPARRTALIVMVLLGAVVAGYVYFVSLYLQHVLEFSALATGLALVPATVTVMAVSTQVTRRLLPRLGTRWMLLVALSLVGIGQFWLAHISTDASYPADVLPGIILTSLGMGLALPTCSIIITANVAPSSRGLAGSMFVTAMQVGSAVGLAVLATAAAANTRTTGSPTDGYALSYLLATGISVLAVVAVGLLLPRAPKHAE
ncbi:MFS transporter [Streptomyces sp. NPDC002755]